MEYLDDILIMFLFVAIFIPAILIVAMSLYRFKGYMAYKMLEWDFRRLPYTTTCTICLETTKDGGLSAVYRLPCSHWFHKICLRKWLERNNNCPNCRHVVNFWNGERLSPIARMIADFNDDFDDEELRPRPRLRSRYTPTNFQVASWPNLRLQGVQRLDYD